MQCNAITLFKEQGVITYYSFVTYMYGAQNKRNKTYNMHNIEVTNHD